jgi:hypothetical protein
VFRRQKDEFFRTHPNSPLSPAQKTVFPGLEYFPHDVDLDVEVRVERIGDTAQIFTTKDTIRNYTRYGTFSLTIDGQPVTLTIYQTPHGFFLPFTDIGDEVYSGGRYIDPESLDDETFRVDFNRAYNPFCVYSDAYDCPIVPKENRLTVAIRAGEKMPSWL